MAVPFLPRWLRPRSYKGLLTALLILLIVQPLAGQLQLSGWALELVLALVLLSAIHEGADDRRGVWVVVILGIPAVVGHLLNAVVPQLPTVVSMGIFAFTFLFLIAVLAALIRDIMTADRVSGDTLRGAVCVYLLLGVIWAITYGFVLFLDPGAIVFADHLVDQAAGRGPFGLLIYFSFVTLTTLGYGDISPISPFARNLAWMEAMVGQLFVAMAIARLVGSYIIHQGEDSDR